MSLADEPQSTWEVVLIPEGVGQRLRGGPEAAMEQGWGNCYELK